MLLDLLVQPGVLPLQRGGLRGQPHVVLLKGDGGDVQLASVRLGLLQFLPQLVAGLLQKPRLLSRGGGEDSGELLTEKKFSEKLCNT